VNVRFLVDRVPGYERASLVVVEPTVIAFGTRAGETLQASWFSFPAATA